MFLDIGKVLAGVFDQRFGEALIHLLATLQNVLAPIVIKIDITHERLELKVPLLVGWYPVHLG